MYMNLICSWKWKTSLQIFYIANFLPKLVFIWILAATNSFIKVSRKGMAPEEDFNFLYTVNLLHTNLHTKAHNVVFLL